MAYEVVSFSLRQKVFQETGEGCIETLLRQYILDLLIEEDTVQAGFWGQEIGNEARIQMLVNWDSVAAHHALQGKEYYLPFVKKLDDITDLTKLQAFHTHLSPYLADHVLDHKNSLVIEFLTAYFPKDYSTSRQLKLHENLENYVADAKSKASALLGFSGGWAVEDLTIPGTSDIGKVYLAVFGWQSMRSRIDFVNLPVIKESQSFLDKAEQLLYKKSVYCSGFRFK